MAIDIDTATGNFSRMLQSYRSSSNKAVNYRNVLHEQAHGYP
jgi:hypothetical protein